MAAWSARFRIRGAVLCLAVAVAGAAPLGAAESLKDWSDAELLQIVVGGVSAMRLEYEAEIYAHLPPGFWELRPRDAALRLAESHCPRRLATKLRFSIDAPAELSPPPRGEIGMRWSCAHCYLAEEGMTILRHAGAKSALAYSRVKVLGLGRNRPSAAAITRAVDQRATVSLREERARHLYEVIWWLGKVQASPVEPPAPNTGEATTERIVSTGDGHGDFWISPPGRRNASQVTFYTEPLSNRYVNGFNTSLQASLAEFLVNTVLEEEGVDLSVPTATIGRDEPLSKQEQFLKSIEKSAGPKEQHPARVSRLLEMLENPTGTWRSSVIWALVPAEDPMRYSDPRIDAALLRILRSAASAGRDPSGGGAIAYAPQAASALGWRECADALPLVLKLLEQPGWDGAKDTFEAVAHIGAAYPRLRGAAIEFIEKRLADASERKDDPVTIVDLIWRGDFREVEPALEARATLSPDEMEDPGRWLPMDDGEPPPKTGRFHLPRAILVAWREPDPLTRLKLNLMIQASSAHSARPPRFLRAQYRELSAEHGAEIRRFIATLEKYPRRYNWSPDRLHADLMAGE